MPEPHVFAKPSSSALRNRLNETIFGYDSRAGRNFDIALLIIIALSISVIVIDSFAPVRKQYGAWLDILEWGFTAFFALEYLTRIYCAEKRREYIFSFYGVIDFLAILPSILIFLIPASEGLVIVRVLRMMRIFRILKAFRFLSEANLLSRSLYAARRKIFVFLCAVVTLIVIFGSLMYAVEGPEHGFTSLPKGIYWAIITVTTVGYGDIVPQTAAGQIIAGCAMLVSYAIIAIPTGIVSAEIFSEVQSAKNSRRCGECSLAGHELDANYCKRCGAVLD